MHYFYRQKFYIVMIQCLYLIVSIIKHFLPRFVQVYWRYFHLEIFYLSTILKYISISLKPFRHRDIIFFDQLLFFNICGFFVFHSRARLWSKKFFRYCKEKLA